MQLDPKQREAVEHGEGPLLIVAGPGSGKTTTIVHRVAHLIQAGKVPPDKILVTTFTKKAAEEMRSRLSSLIGEDAEALWLGTIHSRCLEVLRAKGDAPLVGLQGAFTVVDADDARRRIEKIVQDEAVAVLQSMTGRNSGSFSANMINKAVLDLGLAAMPSRISYAKEWNVEPKDACDILGWKPAAAKVYRLYNTQLHTSNSVDFGDMQMLTIRILHEMPNVLNWIRNRFQFVLVDEYQDTNAVQAELFRLICGQHRNITAVGDADQAVYGWRGSSPKFMLEFQREWPEAHVVYLDTNYRSTESIVKAAQTLIAHNKGRFDDFNPQAAQKGGEKPVVISVADPNDEARAVAREIENLNHNHQTPFREIAVLYRTHGQSRRLEAELLSQQIPHAVIGGMPFMLRKEIQDMLAWLRLLVNPKDDTSFRRAVMAPPRRIGKATLEILAGMQMPLLDAASAIASSPKQAVQLKIGRQQVSGLREIATLCADLEWSLPDANLMAKIAESTGYLQWLATQDDGRTRLENVAELCTLYATFDEHKKAERDGYGVPQDRPIAFIDWAATEMESVQAQRDRVSNSGNVVTLMTMHAAKGTEFDAVLITGCTEGLIPASFAIRLRNTENPYEFAEEESEELLEEERRLFYVAMTRARKHLRIVAPKRLFDVATISGNGAKNGSTERLLLKERRRSRFIDEAGI